MEENVQRREVVFGFEEEVLYYRLASGKTDGLALMKAAISKKCFGNSDRRWGEEQAEI